MKNRVMAGSWVSMLSKKAENLGMTKMEITSTMEIMNSSRTIG